MPGTPGDKICRNFDIERSPLSRETHDQRDDGHSAAPNQSHCWALGSSSFISPSPSARALQGAATTFMASAPPQGEA
jgi:hypothetical protein